MWAGEFCSKVYEYDSMRVVDLYRELFGIDVSATTKVRVIIEVAGCEKGLEEAGIPRRGDRYELDGVAFRVLEAGRCRFVAELLSNDPYFSLLDACKLRTKIKEILRPAVLDIRIIIPM